MADKRLIDANARIEEIKKAYCTDCDNYGGVLCLACWVDDAIGMIDDAHTVDAVEVVRCKDCLSDGSCCIQDAMNWTTGPKLHEYFCSFGERRSDHV